MLEIGKEYTLRNGLKTGRLREAKNGTNYVFEANVKEHGYETDSIFSWKKNGRFLVDMVNHRFDIVF